MKKHAEKLLLFFVVAGLAVAAYSLKQHYGPLGGACNVSRTFSCDVVNKGPYSEIAGFPVAGIGIVGYLVIGIVAMFYRKEKDPVIAKALVAVCAGGLLFSLYLTSIEAFVLYTWCLLCLGSLSAITGATLSSVMMLQNDKTKSWPTDAPRI